MKAAATDKVLFEHANIRVTDTRFETPFESFQIKRISAVRVASEKRKTRIGIPLALAGLTSLLVHASRPEDLPRAFDDAVKQRAQMLVVANDVFFSVNARAIVDLAGRHRIPAIYGNDIYAPLGGLVSYSVRVVEMYRNAALFVDRILKGRKPGDLPFEQPTRFETMLNMKTAKSLGLKIPQSLLVRADRVIE